MVSCPLCAVAITGWGRINSVKKPSPSITPVPIDPLRRSGEPGVAHSPSTDEDPERVPEAAVTPACNADSSDSSDSENGTIHWCDEDVFSNGGA